MRELPQTFQTTASDVAAEAEAEAAPTSAEDAAVGERTPEGIWT